MYSYLGTGAAIDAKNRTEDIFQGLTELITKMLPEEPLAPAHGLLNEILLNVKSWRDEFIKAVTRLGESTFRPALKEARQLWRVCVERNGRGPGYRDDIADYINQWFEDPSQGQLHELLEQHLTDSWSEILVGRLLSLCGATADLPQVVSQD